MSKNGKVLVAMSGGIDSTVSAVMLKNEGYEVIGITMKTWDYAHTKGIRKKETGCCNLESFNDARKAAVKYDFPHYILDIRSEFSEKIIDNFVDEYMAGRTPNPCILCNTHIKWNALLKRADALDCAYIATGHYARKKLYRNRFILQKGKDPNKDQSYVLWGLTQDVLSRTLFPVGNYLKPEIRTIAEKMDLPALTQKKESYEICFIPDNNYRDFLSARNTNTLQNLSNGIFKDKNGKILGTHKGYPFFTIGQRKGLGISLGKPVFVIDILPKENTVILGAEEDLQKTKMLVKNINWIKYTPPFAPVQVLTKIRYRDAGTLSHIRSDTDKGKAEIDFLAPVKGITPGQSAVFYDKEDVIGGGFIES